MEIGPQTTTSFAAFRPSNVIKVATLYSSCQSSRRKRSVWINGGRCVFLEYVFFVESTKRSYVHFWESYCKFGGCLARDS